MKSKVIRELGRAVDDAKRVVRREAVDTRSKWYVGFTVRGFLGGNSANG